MATVDTSAYSAPDRFAAQQRLAGTIARWGHRDSSPYAAQLAALPGHLGAGTPAEVDVSALNARDKSRLAHLVLSWVPEFEPPQFAPVLRRLAADLGA